MKPKPPKPTASTWHAVSITTGIASCPAAKRLGAARFLSRKAPLLPLPDCTRRERCGCTYRHHEDRRQGPRRQEDKVGLRRSRDSTQERRTTRDRRETSDES